jgi:hypothetical protein
MHRVLAGAIAATVTAGGAATANADDVCVWSRIGVWQCGDGHVVTQVYQLPAQPNTIITPVATVPPNGYPPQNYPPNNPYAPR